MPQLRPERLETTKQEDYLCLVFTKEEAGIFAAVIKQLHPHSQQFKQRAIAALATAEARHMLASIHEEISDKITPTPLGGPKENPFAKDTTSVDEPGLPELHERFAGPIGDGHDS